MAMLFADMMRKGAAVQTRMAGKRRLEFRVRYPDRRQSSRRAMAYVLPRNLGAAGRRAISLRYCGR